MGSRPYGQAGIDSAHSCVLALEMEWLEELGRAGAGTGIREHRGAADQAFQVAKRVEARVLGSGGRKAG